MKLAGSIPLCLLALFLALSLPVSITFAADELSRVNTSCEVDADCAVKDLRNCCGLYPACVNTAAVINTELDDPQCDGFASICGYETITECHCQDHQCQRIDHRPPAVGPVSE